MFVYPDFTTGLNYIRLYKTSGLKSINSWCTATWHPHFS